MNSKFRLKVKFFELIKILKSNDRKTFNFRFQRGRQLVGDWHQDCVAGRFPGANQTGHCAIRAH